MKQNFQFSMNCVTGNVNSVKMCVTQYKSRIMINVDMNVNNQSTGVFVKMCLSGIVVDVVASVLKQVKLMNIQLLKENVRN